MIKCVVFSAPWPWQGFSMLDVLVHTQMCSITLCFLLLMSFVSKPKSAQWFCTGTLPGPFWRVSLLPRAAWCFPAVWRKHDLAPRTGINGPSRFETRTRSTECFLKLWMFNQFNHTVSFLNILITYHNLNLNLIVIVVNPPSSFLKRILTSSMSLPPSSQPNRGCMNGRMLFPMTWEIHATGARKTDGLPLPNISINYSNKSWCECRLLFPLIWRVAFPSDSPYLLINVFIYIVGKDVLASFFPILASSPLTFLGVPVPRFFRLPLPRSQAKSGFSDKNTFPPTKPQTEISFFPS